MTSTIKTNARCIAILLTAALAQGCATNPDRLQTPRNLTCVYLKHPLSFTGHYGLLNIPWTTRLERGPYWSEKMDENGTFYRAPPGGVSIRSESGAGFPGHGATFDGGFYVPSNPSKPVTIYRYFSTADVPAKIPPSEANCSTLGYTKEPSTSKVSLVSFAVNGAVGGAAGGLIGRGISSGDMSYGQAAGVGAAGGLIGGLVVAAIINADVGKIIPGMPIQDNQFIDKIRDLVAGQVPLRELGPPVPAGAAQSQPPNTP